MTMNPTITEQAPAMAGSDERGFDPFASLPVSAGDSRLGGAPVASPVAGGDTAEGAEQADTEAPPADPRYAALETKVSEMEAWKAAQLEREQQQQAEQQRASQSEYEQQFQREQAEIVELARQAAVGMDDAERGKLFKAVDDAAWGRVFNRPEAKQQLAGIVAQAQEYQRSKETEALIDRYFGHNTTRARFKELHERLMRFDQAAAREEFAKEMANGQRRQNLDNGVGNPRVEGPGNGGYTPPMNARERYQRWLRTGEGPRPTSEEIDRLTAGYLR